MPYTLADYAPRWQEVSDASVGISGFTDPDRPGCCCDDPQVDTLRDLIASGVGQWAASRLQWGRGTVLGATA